MKTWLILLLTFWLWGAGNLVDKVLFVVDGKPFLLSDYVGYLSMSDMKKVDRLPEDPAKLDDFINLVVLSMEAEKKGYSVSDEDLDRDLQMLAMRVGKTKDEFGSFLKNNLGISLNRFRELRRMYILSSYLVNPQLKKISVTPGELRSFYRQHRKDFVIENVTIWLINTDRNDVREGVYPMKEISRLFPDAITSEIAVKRGDFRKDIEDKLFGAPRGMLIGPLGSEGNFVYLYVVKPKSLAPLPFNVVEDRIRTIILEDKKKKVFEKIIGEVRENHFVERCFTVENGEVDYNERGSCGDR